MSDRGRRSARWFGLTWPYAAGRGRYTQPIWVLGLYQPLRKSLRAPDYPWDDIDLIELNEAFAAQVLAVLKEWQLDSWDKLNVNGSGISLGHPIAANGSPYPHHIAA